jgi:predicted homoserine dehydrogenase-like protein
VARHQAPHLPGHPLVPTGGDGAGVVAKRDLAVGEVLDGEGGYTVWGKLLPAATSMQMGGLPLGLAHGPTVVRPVKKGQSLCWDDVVMDTTTRAYALRKELEAGFVPGGGLG